MQVSANVAAAAHIAIIHPVPNAAHTGMTHPVAADALTIVTVTFAHVDLTVRHGCSVKEKVGMERGHHSYITLRGALGRCGRHQWSEHPVQPFGGDRNIDCLLSSCTEFKSYCSDLTRCCSCRKRCHERGTEQVMFQLPAFSIPAHHSKLRRNNKSTQRRQPSVDST